MKFKVTANKNSLDRLIKSPATYIVCSGLDHAVDGSSASTICLNDTKSQPNKLALKKDVQSVDGSPDQEQPRTAQLIGNVIIRSLIAGATGNYIAIKHADLMAAAANIATSSMWISEDFSTLFQRIRDIKSGKYCEKPLENPKLKFKDVKTPEDLEGCVDQWLERFGRSVMTKSAFKEMLPFMAFDFVQGELYGSYQDRHPSTSYRNSKDFLLQTKNMLMASAVAGLVTYPLQDIMDQIPGNIAKFIGKMVLKSPQSKKQFQNPSINGKKES